MTTSRIGRPGAVVLAAGESSRMGRPKALLEYQGTSFLARWLALLRAAGTDEVAVVLGHDRQRIEAMTDVTGVHVVTNPHPERGMLSSFILGLDALPERISGVFLCPVDHPAVSRSDLAALADRSSPRKIVVPVHAGRRGHPVLFGVGLFGEIRSAPERVGARAVVRADPDRVVEVPAGPGILQDIDTPADYTALGEVSGPVEG
ncbi:MAG: NTP transferase domain-containing protein [Acidobacteriota bacterium]